MRVLVEGIGGCGGVIAGELIRAGAEPVLLTGNPEIARVIHEDGLKYTTPAGTWTVPAAAYPRVSDLPPDSRFDAALLVMKANRVMEAVRDTLPVLADDGYLVTMQNGIVEDSVVEVAGAERVVSGIISWGGTMHGPGVVERTSVGATHLGELSGGRSDRVDALAEYLRPVGDIDVNTNIRGALWAKLAINCSVSTLGALTGDGLGTMLSRARVRRVFLGIYREVVDTAEAQGIVLQKTTADPHLLYLPADAGALTRLYKDLLCRVVGFRYRKLKSSSLQSLQRGRKTEVDYLNGYVVARAAEAGVDVPLNTTLTRLLHEVEEGERPIEPSNLEELLKLV